MKEEAEKFAKSFGRLLNDDKAKLLSKNYPDNAVIMAPGLKTLCGPAGNGYHHIRNKSHKKMQPTMH